MGDYLPAITCWVKEDKVLDLHIPGMDSGRLPAQTFLACSGLTLSMERGGYVLSKRLSRVMRPYRYGRFFDAAEVAIDYNAQLNPRLWDGCGQVSRGFVQRLADSLSLDARHRRELLHANRFEVTTLHAGGQDKGHVLVLDDLAVDFMFPAGSARQELALVDGRVFVGLQPVHSEDQMCLDIQSLVNLHPFFRPEQLLVWSKQAEAANQYLSKGRQVLIEGRLRPDPETGGPRVYSRQDGSAGASFEVVADRVQFLGGNGNGNGAHVDGQAEGEPAYNAEDDGRVTSV